MTKILLIGYGNPGRLDDGLGPALAEAVAALGLPGVTVDSDYQLTVEDAAAAAENDVVIFADASVNGEEPFFFREIVAEGTLGFSSHSVDPEAVLAMAVDLFGAKTKGYALGIRGYQFDEFGERLSDKARENLDDLWLTLSDGGQVLMPLEAYPFSKRYGWVKDRFGLTWQLILTDPAGEPRPFIIPSLLFTKKNTNQAEEAINYYVSLFEDSKVGDLAYYPEDTGPAKKGALGFGNFMLADQWFAAMDSGVEHHFMFNEAISFSVACKDQAEIDTYWEKLSSDPQFEQCGWCKDKYGVSWQIVPENMEELMERSNAFAHLMEMKKIIISEF